MGITTPRATILKDALEHRHVQKTPTRALLTVDETMAMLRVSKWTLYRLMQRNELKSVKIGKKRLFQETDLLTFVEQHKVEALV